MDKIILVGDIHGEFGRLRYDLTRMYENAYIIQVGDFGMGFYKPGYYETELRVLQQALEQKNCKLFAIRGNHDNPESFKETTNPFGFDRITLLKDYSELNLLDKNILLVGGAVSIDRKWRIEKMKQLRENGRDSVLWWEDEGFDTSLISNITNKYDIVVTHTRPSICGPFKGCNIGGFLEDDSLLKDDLLNETRDVQKLYEATKPVSWYYGHFHVSEIAHIEETTFRCLNIHEHYEHKLHP
jgi:predicted phosphodiesterase